jgi:hypothetical protein
MRGSSNIKDMVIVTALTPLDWSGCGSIKQQKFPITQRTTAMSQTECELQ